METKRTHPAHASSWRRVLGTAAGLGFMVAGVLLAPFAASVLIFGGAFLAHRAERGKWPCA